MYLSQIQSLSKSLRAAVWDGVAFSVMFGLGESYLIAFAIFLGASEFSIGALSSIPILCGALAQLYGVHRMHRQACRRTFIVRFVILQALIWIPIAALLFFPQYPGFTVLMLVLLACTYQAFGNLVGPAWMSLIGDLVPEDTRGRYFGFRNSICGMAILAGIISGGVVLHHYDNSEGAALAFFIIFFISAVARLISAFYLDRYDSVPYEPTKKSQFSFVDFLRSEEHRDFAQFSMYQTYMQFAVFLVAPYFAVYFLRELQFSYLQFMGVVAMGLFVQLLVAQTWGRLADRFGNRRIILVSGLLLTLNPILMVCSTNYWYLLFVPQVVGGISWAGFNLSSGNYLFDSVSREARAQASAYLALLRALAIVSGAFAGSLLLSLVDTPSLPVTPLVFVFILSGCLRLGVNVLFSRRFEERRLVEQA